MNGRTDRLMSPRILFEYLPASPLRWEYSQRACRAVSPCASLLVAFVILGLSAGSATAQAQNGSPHDPGDHSYGLGADIKAYVTAPLYWNSHRWLQFGGSLLAITAAYQLDDDVRDHFVAGDSGLDVRDTHDLEDAVPAVVALAGTWAFATLTDSDDGRRETKEMVEAAVFGSAASFVFKQVAGRQRPYETVDHGDWTDGGDAFPSMHATAAFAIGTVLAESGDDDYRWMRRTLGYGLAAGTAYQRLNHNVHWLSDTVAGAALGIATAHFVMNRHEPAGERAELAVVPLDGGLMLTYTARLRR